MNYAMHKYKLWHTLMHHFFTGHTSHNQSVMSPPNHHCSSVNKLLALRTPMLRQVLPLQCPVSVGTHLIFYPRNKSLPILEGGRWGE